MPRISKYELYEAAVQDPDNEVELFESVYQDAYHRIPHVMREDFCGTFANSCAWVKRDSKHRAIGIDFDSEPLRYGRKTHLAKLDPDQKKRVKLLQKNVLRVQNPKVDIITASNFSSFHFKTRKEFLTYAKSCYRALKSKGVFAMDVLGGTESMQESQETRRGQRTDSGQRFTYIWEQKFYDAITHEALFYIHFKFPDGSIRKRAFKYDWRMWGIRELREILLEAGFRKTFVYWEGDDDDGGGNGIFKKREKEENCETWIAYVVGVK